MKKDIEFLVIENTPLRALEFESFEIDIVFIDLEKLGKQERQGHLDSVKSNHSIEDIVKIKESLKKSKVLVRIDPINPNTSEQIERVIKAGADVIMLPFFTTFKEVEFFFNCVKGRVQTKLLFEHKDSLNLLERIHNTFNITEIYFGLNDLSLSLGYKFMFKVLADEILNDSLKYCIQNNIKYGIGGIGRYNIGKVPGKVVLREYKRLGASSTIISRGLVNVFNQDKLAFKEELDLLRNDWNTMPKDEKELNENFKKLKSLVNSIEAGI